MEKKIKNCKIPSIEVLRVVSIFAVLYMHTVKLGEIRQYKIPSCLIHQLCRFAVPCFFLISGYLFAKSIKGKEFSYSIIWSYLKRLGVLFISWTLIYKLMPGLVIDLVRSIVKNSFYNGLVYPIKERFITMLNLAYTHPIRFCLEGYIHLWFLVSLMIGIFLLWFLILLKKERYIIPFSMGIYILGLLGKAYANTPLGLHYLAVHLNTRDGPFFSFIFVAIGWWLYNRKGRISLPFAISLAAIGYILQLVEMFTLYPWATVDTHIYTTDYVLGTLPFGIGVFMVILAMPKLGEKTTFVKIGKLVGGIYVAHFLVMNNIDFTLLHKFLGPIAWQIVFPFILFFCTVGFVILLQKFKLTSWLVTGKFNTR